VKITVIGKTGGKRPFGSIRRIYDNIKWFLKEIVCEGVD
jgi:hypothetical protein